MNNIIWLLDKLTIIPFIAIRLTCQKCTSRRGNHLNLIHDGNDLLGYWVATRTSLDVSRQNTDAEHMNQIRLFLFIIYSSAELLFNRKWLRTSISQLTHSQFTAFNYTIAHFPSNFLLRSTRHWFHYFLMILMIFFMMVVVWKCDGDGARNDTRCCSRGQHKTEGPGTGHATKRLRLPECQGRTLQGNTRPTVGAKPTSLRLVAPSRTGR